MVRHRDGEQADACEIPAALVNLSELVHGDGGSCGQVDAKGSGRYPNENRRNSGCAQSENAVMVPVR